MNEELDSRALHFACSVGVHYSLALLVTKRIPQETVIFHPNGKKSNRNGDRKVFNFLMKLYQLKNSYNLNYPTGLFIAEKRAYLQEIDHKKQIQKLSDAEIDDLYLRYRILENIGHFLPPEIKIDELNRSEVNTLVDWLF